MTQTILTFITKVDPGKRSRLESLLEQIESDLGGNQYIPFANLNLLHFASFVILDDDNFDSCLVFENNFDGPLDSYLDELLKHAGAGLHEIYGCCPDYPAEPYEPSKLAGYLHAHVVRPNAFHIGNVGRSADRIKREKLLREQVEDHLDELAAADKTEDTPASLRNYIQQFIQNTPALAWAVGKVGPRQTFAEWILPRLKIIALIIAALLFLPLLIPVSIIWLIILRRKEKRDLSQTQPANSGHIRKVSKREDRIAQNHLASITTVKSGWFRRFTLKVVLWLANTVARTSDKGELVGIPSIHFAHWVLIDNGRRLLFFSNFDGSWGNYLDDFIDKASFGLTGIWSNTAGFPPTRFLVLDGAKNGPDFKAFARDSQTPSLVWYSAYTTLTVQNVDSDSAIREGVFTTLDDSETKDWLQNF